MCSSDLFSNVQDRKDLTGKLTNHHEGGNAEALDKLKRLGRFPANFIHDGHKQVLDLFPGDDETSAGRFFYCPKASKSDRDDGLDGFEENGYSMSGNDSEKSGDIGLNKIVKRKNVHPTVKPTELMRYLCRLITPPNGLILDPFTGSGSTGKAAMLEGFRFVGCELSEEYIKIAEARINAAKEQGGQP